MCAYSSRQCKRCTGAVVDCEYGVWTLCLRKYNNVTRLPQGCVDSLQYSVITQCLLSKMASQDQQTNNRDTPQQLYVNAVQWKMAWTCVTTAALMGAALFSAVRRRDTDIFMHRRWGFFSRSIPGKTSEKNRSAQSTRRDPTRPTGEDTNFS